MIPEASARRGPRSVIWGHAAGAEPQRFIAGFSIVRDDFERRGPSSQHRLQFGGDPAFEAHEPASEVLLRGARCTCPNCGTGNLFKSFLEVARACNVCGEEFHSHQADDLPACIVIFLVGHIVVGLLLLTEIFLAPPIWVHVLIWFPLTFVLALVWLRPVKGLIVALQWHLGLLGFEHRAEL